MKNLYFIKILKILQIYVDKLCKLCYNKNCKIFNGGREKC